MNILVTGAAGQLGTDVVLACERHGDTVVQTDVSTCDITDRAQVEALFASACPQAVIHCAAYTQVDRAEDEPAVCYSVNVTGSENIARASAACGARLLYVSTDYVFGDNGTQPLQTDSPQNPQSVYGKTKLLGEQVTQALCESSFVVRVSWVFGQHGGNFVKTMLRLAKEQHTLRVVDDQVGSPTYTPDLAVLLCELIHTKRYGVYHATNEGTCSWAAFAQEIMAQANLPVQVVPISGEAYAAKAKRPQNSRLSKTSLDAAGFARLPTWQDALKRFLQATGYAT